MCSVSPQWAVAVGCYWLWDEAVTDGIDTLETVLSSVGVGAKGTANLGPVNVSLLYLIGVSNSFSVLFNGTEVGSADMSSSLLELKGTFQFSETIGAFLVYRSYGYQPEGLTSTDLSGFGVGIQATF